MASDLESRVSGVVGSSIDFGPSAAAGVPGFGSSSVQRFSARTSNPRGLLPRAATAHKAQNRAGMNLLDRRCRSYFLESFKLEALPIRWSTTKPLWPGAKMVMLQVVVVFMVGVTVMAMFYRHALGGAKDARVQSEAQAHKPPTSYEGTVHSPSIYVYYLCTFLDS